ncbi:MAG: hypothetical protein BGP24_16240 [Lysobacterales bacterium 69-70]|nr:DUF3240 family protein [Xanthomonadaceae bacterium]ODU32467.1 MAG: hypothetical protein ABS97_15860 [Xanthomonadaceae bacterium SCN 69-320]ODV16323.1 MAG: hypothetical protein ABT27_20410 [Xanthomonadaceae bacterium SCN 69-25]OJY97533.1 MAG: hypothetical protein BGP24_16240 [Xanthomonadales bacterium 69-70]
MTAWPETHAPDRQVRLNLVFPPNLEDAVTEALLEDPALPGFTLLHAEGHSSDFAKASAREQVRGRVDRRVLWIVIHHERLDSVLGALRRRIAGGDLRWWVEPVLAVGRFA